jgi:hypothetical protein
VIQLPSGLSLGLASSSRPVRGNKSRTDCDRACEGVGRRLALKTINLAPTFVFIFLFSPLIGLSELP